MRMATCLRHVVMQGRMWWVAGMDGFYDRRSCQAAGGNPSSWAGYTGQDFLPQHAVNGAPASCIGQSP